ncbi:MAG: hypothetical protein IT306_29215 [Chloroflexi bacterium]|nr:hypothetical protein [Chloroflexota bacterium]
MVSLAVRRQEIAAALSTVDGLRVDPEGLWTDRTNYPTALIRPADDAELATFDGMWRTPLEITVAVSAAGGLARGQRTLDELHDAVIGAFNDNLPACGVIRRLAYGVLEIDGTEVFGAVFRVEYLD